MISIPFEAPSPEALRVLREAHAEAHIHTVEAVRRAVELRSRETKLAEELDLAELQVEIAQLSQTRRAQLLEPYPPALSRSLSWWRMRHWVGPLENATLRFTWSSKGQLARKLLGVE